MTLRVNLPDSISAGGFDWYPAPSDDFAVKGAQVRLQNGVAVVTFILQSFSGRIKTGEPFESLMLYRDLTGRRKSVQLITPVPPM
jgi:hypothetical protein